MMTSKSFRAVLPPLSDEELQAWSGLIGHQHITTRKTDPGPAFDWDLIQSLARQTTP